MATCSGKKRFGTIRSATVGKRRIFAYSSISIEEMNDLQPYRCPICGFYHLGHKSKYETNISNGMPIPQSKE